MSYQEWQRYCGLLAGALLINTLLFAGISLLCRETPTAKSAGASDPILLTMGPAPMAPTAEPIAVQPPPPADPQPVEKLPVVPEPDAAPESAKEIDIPEVESPPAPQLSAAAVLPKPTPQVRPKTEKKPRTVREPRPVAPAPTNPNPVQAGGNHTASDQSSAGTSTGSGAASSSLDSREFGADEVDQRPRVIKQEQPTYPLVARRRSLSGKVTVKFLVDRSGRVVKPKVLDAHPKGIFEQSVLESIARWQFKPGRYQGKEVATWVVLPIQFRLEGS